MKIIVYLLILGLALTPFVIYKGMDTRTPKEIVAFGIALAVGLLALYSGQLKKFDNFWFLLLVGFFFISMLAAPNFREFFLGIARGKELTIIADRSMSGIWAFKPYLYALVYLLLMITVASLDLSWKDVKTLFFVMALSGFLTALYVMLQYVKMDQIFTIVSKDVNPDVTSLDQPLLAGFLGHATVVSVFIAMVIPFALFFKKYLWTAVMIVAVCVTESKVAIGAMVCGLTLLSLVSQNWKVKAAGRLLIIGLMVSGLFFVSQYPNRDWGEWIKGESNGRIPVWTRIWGDFTTPINGHKHVLTGFGPGAYNFTFSIRKGSRFWQAHNEPLEALYNFGFAGILLMFMALRLMIKRKLALFLIGERGTVTLLSSFFIIFLCGLGTFPFQIAPMMFYTTVIIGLLHNKKAAEWIILKG